MSVEVVSNYDQSVARGIAYGVLDILTGKTPDVITWPIGRALPKCSFGTVWKKQKHSIRN